MDSINVSECLRYHVNSVSAVHTVVQLCKDAHLHRHDQPSVSCYKNQHYCTCISGCDLLDLLAVLLHVQTWMHLSDKCVSAQMKVVTEIPLE